MTAVLRTIGKRSRGERGGDRPVADSYKLRLYWPQSWTVEGLRSLLQRGPVALMGPIPSLHAVVIGGIQSDGTSDGTFLTIYDPWPPGVGGVHFPAYGPFMRLFPMATMYLLQR